MWVNIGIIKDQIHHNLLPTTMHKYQIWPLAPEIETTKVKEKYQIWSLAPEIEARKNKERNFFYAKQEYIFFPADSSCRLLVSGSNPCVSGGDASRTREKLVALRLDLGLRPESEKGWNEGKIGGIRTSIAAGVFFFFFLVSSSKIHHLPWWIGWPRQPGQHEGSSRKRSTGKKERGRKVSGAEARLHELNLNQTEERSSVARKLCFRRARLRGYFFTGSSMPMDQCRQPNTMRHTM